MQIIKKTNAFIVNFEDLGPGRKHANLVFNPIFNLIKKENKLKVIMEGAWKKIEELEKEKE